MIMLIGRVDRMPVAITIAGSDSGGGAGIEADLKTFASMFVHGTVALTAVTAQNTFEVTRVHPIPVDIVIEQIEVVYRDIGIDAGKTGMLFSKDIISAVARTVDKLDFPLVVDPVMIAKSGAQLLRDDAINTLIDELIPVATVITPNRFEAERIVGFNIKNMTDMERAAKEIYRLGAEAVLVKGGHVFGDKSIDVLYYNGRFNKYEAPRFEVKTTHGTGCSLSAAIAAGLAHGLGIEEAVGEAKKLITDAIRFGLRIGKGHGPVNPMAPLYRDASKVYVREELIRFVGWLRSLEGVSKLVPEVGMNIAYSALYPVEKYDFVAIPGRIRRLPTNGISVSTPEFGGSDHLARYLLALQKRFPEVRVAMNIKYEANIIDHLRYKGYRVSSYDRSKEPPTLKNMEGGTIGWGVQNAIKNLSEYPHVIYHLGDVGKEPMIVLFGRDLEDLRQLLMVVMEVI